MKRLVVLAAVLLCLLGAPSLVAAGSTDLVLEAAWNKKILDSDSDGIGDLTYKISGGNGSIQNTLRNAVADWDSWFSELEFIEITARNQKPDINIQFKNQGYPFFLGSNTRRYDRAGFVTSTEISILGANLDTTNETALLETARHEFGHALGLGHANFTGDLMYETTAGVGFITNCDIAGVRMANRWFFENYSALDRSHLPMILDCSTVAP